MQSWDGVTTSRTAAAAPAGPESWLLPAHHAATSPAAANVWFCWLLEERSQGNFGQILALGKYFRWLLSAWQNRRRIRASSAPHGHKPNCCECLVLLASSETIRKQLCAFCRSSSVFPLPVCTLPLYPSACILILIPVFSFLFIFVLIYLILSFLPQFVLIVSSSAAFGLKFLYIFLFIPRYLLFFISLLPFFFVSLFSSSLLPFSPYFLASSFVHPFVFI
jgi:hypothetical protein